MATRLFTDEEVFGHRAAPATRPLTDEEVFGAAAPARPKVKGRDLFAEAGIQPRREGRDLFAEAGIAPRREPDEPDTAPERSAGDYARDAVAIGLKSAIAVPEAAVGLLNLGTKGYAFMRNLGPQSDVGKLVESAGVRFEDARKFVDEEISSDAQRAARKKVADAEGFVDTAKAMVQNPSTIVEGAGESLGMMGMGGAFGRVAMKVAPKVAPWLAAALGEGVVSTGTAAEKARSESEDGLLSGRDAAAAVGTGAGTALFGAAGGKLAQRLGLGDADTMLTTGLKGLAATPQKAQAFLKAVVGSGISEGVFEEMPQSAQEAMWENWAKGRPLTEGVDKAMAQGLVVGTAMGAGAGAVHGSRVGAGNAPEDRERAPTDPAAPTAPAGQAAAQPTALAAGASKTKRVDPTVRLAELEVESSQRALTGDELAEVERLSAEADTPGADISASNVESRTSLFTPRSITMLDRLTQIDTALSAQPEDGEAAALLAERTRIVQSFPATILGAAATFSTEAGAKVEGRYALVEADELVTSHDENLRANPAYPSELQPRERDRAASEAQIAGIVQRLDPARLGLSADAATGAPIIGADGLVESGNARSIALKRAYQADGLKADEYRQFLASNAPQFGLAPEAVAGMRNPVLVRVRDTPVDRAEFARQANASTVAAMSPSEQARSDSARIDSMEDLNPDDDGQFTGPGSRDFIRRFMARLPMTEQAGMVEADGSLSQAGYTRVRNAVLAKAYGDSPVLRRMTESLDDNARNVTRALMIAAPKVATTREAIAAGRRHDADFTPDLLSAVEELASLKDRGQSVDDALAQAGLLGDAYSPETRDVMRFLADNTRRPRRMADFITGFMDALDAAGDPNQGSLLGDATAPSKLDLMTVAQRGLHVGAAQDAQRRDVRADAAPGAAPRNQPEDAPGAGRVDARDVAAVGGDSRLSRDGSAGSGQAAGKVDGQWRGFPPESGTLGIPRDRMPQVKMTDRGALVQFMNARGVEHETDEMDAAALKPTQAEFSLDKVRRLVDGSQAQPNMTTLVSGDGYVLDGHHRWLATMAEGKPLRVLRFKAPARQVLDLLEEFPSASRSSSSSSHDLPARRAAAVADFKAALADLAAIASRHTRASMVPEDTPGLMPTLVRLMKAGVSVVGHDVRALVRWAQQQMRDDPALQRFWNRVSAGTYANAAREAIESEQRAGAGATVIVDNSDGLPKYEFDGIVLAFPVETERLEVIPQDGQRVVQYAVMPSDGFDLLGTVELLLDASGRPVSLLDIEMSTRRGGTGSKVIEALLRAYPGSDLNISNIVPAAQGFWEKIGVPVQNLEEGAAYDGTLDLETYLQAKDGRRARGLDGRRAPADRRADAAAEAGRDGAPSQGENEGRRRQVGDEPPADSTPLSRRTGSGEGLYAAQVQAVVTRAQLRMRGMPRVHVLQSPADLAHTGTHGRLRASIEQRGALQDAEGAVHEGEVYLFAGHLSDATRAEHVLVEHELAHLGLRMLLGDARTQTMRMLSVQNGRIRKAAAAMMRAQPDLTEAEAIEEFIVDLPSAELARLAGWRKVVDLVREALTALGFQRLADRMSRWARAGLDGQAKADLFVADLVRAARRRATQGPAAATVAAAGDTAAIAPALSRRDDAGETDAGTKPQPGQDGQPDPNDPNPWRRLKARVEALTSPEALDKMLYEFQDKLVDLKRLRQHIAALGGTVNDLNDAYLGEELFHARLAKRTHDFIDTELRPMLAAARAADIGVPMLERYLHARHAPEANRVLAERNPSQAMVDMARAKAAAQVRELQLQRQRSAAQGSATRGIDDALAEAQAELSRQNRVQPFRGTEADRLSLSGMSDEQAAEFIASLTPKQRQSLTNLAERVDAMQERTLKALQEYGLMSREALDAWRAAYEHYVPLHRDEAKAEGDRHPIGQGFNVKGDASRRRTGSNEAVTNILSHIVMQREAALTRGEKNLVTKRLYLMAAQNPDPNWWSVDKAPTMQVVDPATGTVRTTVDPTYRNRPDVLMVRIAGRDQAIVFNERNPRALRLAESMKNLDTGDLHVVLGLAAKGTRWFASVNTQYNPIFGIINLARDVQAGVLNLSTTPLRGSEVQVLARVPAALRAIYRQRRGKDAANAQLAALWQDFQDAGGPTGYRDVFVKVEDRAQALAREIGALDRGQVSKAAHAIVDWLSDYNEAMENAVRLSAYEVALKEGVPRERAASLAKNLTVNFNRKGRQTREIGALYAFFNAAVQGTARMFETLSGPLGRRIMVGGVTVGAVNALVGMAAMGGDDDEPDRWQQIPEFIRERSFIVPLGAEDYLTIPMPLGFHVFPNIGRLAVEFAFGESDKSNAAKLGDLLMIVADAFNPLGGAQNVSQMVAPTVIDPVVALMENRDWTGRPIYRESVSSTEPQPGHARARDSASTFSAAAARAINHVTGGTEYRPGAWSPTPDQIDYVIGQLTGGLGRELIKVNQTLAAPVTGDDLPPYKIPLVGRLYGNTRGEAGQAGRFYENVRAVNEVEAELRGRMRNGEDFEEWRDGEPLVQLIGRGAATERMVLRARQARRAITEQAQPGYQDRVRDIDRTIADAMAGFNAEVDRVRREARETAPAQ